MQIDASIVILVRFRGRYVFDAPDNNQHWQQVEVNIKLASFYRSPMCAVRLTEWRQRNDQTQIFELWNEIVLGSTHMITKTNKTNKMFPKMLT